MAFLADDDKLQDPNLPTGSQSTDTAGDNSVGQSGMSSIVTPSTGATGVSTAGVGAGGQSGWTNIQAYLNANKGNTSSAKLVDDVGSKFSDERSKLNDTATTAKTTADSEAEKTNIGQDKASQLIEQAATGQRNSDPYNQVKTTLQSALNAQYGGPNDYTFARDAKNTDYGTRMGDDTQFSGLMDNIYKDATGGRISNGQLNLQHQFDVQDDTAAALQDSRQKALTNYAGLDADYNNIVPSTDAAVKADQARFGTQQTALNDYIGNRASQSNNSIESALSAFNDEENAIKNQNIKGENEYQHYLGANGTAGWGYDDRILNSGQFVKYTPGIEATRASIGGVDSDRNVWNAIQDILNKQDQMVDKSDVEATHGLKDIDQQAKKDAWAKIDAEELNKYGMGRAGDRMGQAMRDAYDGMTHRGNSGESGFGGLLG